MRARKHVEYLGSQGEQSELQTVECGRELEVHVRSRRGPKAYGSAHGVQMRSKSRPPKRTSGLVSLMWHEAA